ncbi:glycine-rich domain-containing protein [Pararhodonellum marinum]|uniref:glycine-rich domain-containing protein n=1 Tax=Pararhodonellum marinum TaxID=2755358 RepID=UPI0018901465|nr:hypothetical protein [Pararhodonellum marinum]
MKRFYQLIFVTVFLTLFSQYSESQTFTSNQNGNWSTAGIWTRTNPFGCAVLRNAPPATSDYAANCRVDVVVNHEVVFDSNNEFGGGYFGTLNINGPNGNLIFQQNLTFNTSGSSLPAPNNVIINVNNGGQINAPNGTIFVDRGGVINITGNSTVTVRDLILNSNNATINVAPGSQLIVLGTTTINSTTVLNVEGQFRTNILTFNSGGNLNALGNSQIRIQGNLNLSNGSFNLREDTDVRIGGNINMSGGGAFDVRGNSYLQASGNLNVNSNNPVFITNEANFIVDGNRNGFFGNLLTQENGCYQSANDGSTCTRTSGDPCSLTSTIEDGAVVIITYFCNGSWSPPENLTEYQVLVVGGGGGGGRTNSGNANKAGGGGGGGAVLGQTFSIPAPGIPMGSNYAITVGNGGTGGATTTALKNGQPSTFNNGVILITAGGGGGGGRSNARNGLPGSNNSSGGGAGAQTTGDTGDGGPGNGNGTNGGSSFSSGNSNRQWGGGGGGAGGIGESVTNSNASGGIGGIGLLSNINGIPQRFGAGGGGGAPSSSNYGAGGNGGGGSGGDANTPASPGLSGTGGGGGGAGGNNRAGGNGGSGVVIIRYEIARILPVEFLYLNAKYQPESRSSKVTWSTSKEWENSHFEVERSVDGIKSFAKIGQVAGAGWSDEISEYLFEDRQLPLVGGKLYYRIKQVDFNGSHSYSRTMMITVPKLEFAKGVWRPYPNPTTGDQFQISLLDAQEYKNEPLQIRMIANLASTPYHAAQNEQELSQLASEFLKKASKGLVILEIRWGNKVEHLKVMKK